MSYLLRQELICLDSRPWYKPQRRSAIRPSCRNVHGAAIGQFHSRITVANGPLLPTAGLADAAVRLSHCSHSCRAQHFVGWHVGQRTKHA